MDINDNQQANIFVGGMNTDTSDSILESNKYRFAKNLRLTTDTNSNSGELRLIEGSSAALLDDKEGYAQHIIKFESIRDYLIVIRCSLDQETNYVDKWYIDVHIVPQNGQLTQSENTNRCLFGGCSFNTESGKITREQAELLTNQLSIVTRYEYNNNIKMYMADASGLICDTGIMSINIDKLHWPQDPQSIPNTIDYLIGYQNEKLPPIQTTINQNVSGNIQAARVQYCYRIYKQGGAASSLSPFSKVLSLYKTATTGYAAEKRTSAAVDIQIQFTGNEQLDCIQLFRIVYVVNGQSPTVDMIYDGKMQDMHPFMYIDTGFASIYRSTVDQLLGTDNLYMWPKQIESKENYLYAANVTYQVDEFDKQIDDAIGKYGFVSYCKGQKTLVDEQLVNNTDPFEHKQFETIPYKYEDEYWESETENGPNGTGQHVDWKYTFDEIAYQYPIVGNQARITKYTQSRSFRRGEVYRFGIVLYGENGERSSVRWIADIMMPTYASQLNKAHLLPNDQRSAQDTSITIESAAKQYVSILKNIGIEFTVHDLPPFIKGYEIVRCIRTTADANILMQGIAGFPVEVDVTDDGTAEPDSKCIYPTGPLTFETVNNNAFKSPENTDKVFNIHSNTSIVQFACPEYCYQQDDVKDLLTAYKSNVSLDSVCVYDIYSEPIPHQYQYTGVLFDDLIRLKPIGASYKGIPIKETDAGYFSEIGVYNYKMLSDSFDQLRYYDPNARVNLTTAADYTSDWTQDSLNECNYLYSAELLQAAYTRKEKAPIVNVPTPIPGDLQNDEVQAVPEPLDLVQLGNVDDIKFPKQPEWNEFYNGDNINFLNTYCGIDGKKFIPWTAFALDTYSVEKESDLDKVFTATDADKPVRYNIASFPIGALGRQILFKLSKETKGYTGWIPENNNITDTYKYGYTMPICVINVTKPSASYNGHTEQSTQTSTYYSFGDISDYTYGTDSTIDVFSGDCTNSMFSYNATLNWVDQTHGYALHGSYTYELPIESSIDLRAVYGDLYDPQEAGSVLHQDKACYIQTDPITFVQNNDAYLYNTAYSQEPNIRSYYTTQTNNNIQNNNYDTRIHNSLPKTNGENIDSWLQFKSADFLDADSRFGPITNLRLFKNSLLCWQDTATATVLSNETAIIQDSNSSDIILGTGAILQRLDYISTIYGMKQFHKSDVQSQDAIYWYDYINNDILQYMPGNHLTVRKVTPLARTKGVKNYLNKLIQPNESSQDRLPYLFYDKKYREIICRLNNSDKSLVFNEDLQTFTGEYTINAVTSADINGNLIYSERDGSTNGFCGSNMYIWNKPANTSVSRISGKYITPQVDFVINKNNTLTKVFDIQTIGGKLYDGKDELESISIGYITPLGQESQASGSNITNRECDFRITIPRDQDPDYGSRLRGKTMQCQLTSNINSTDFSLQYIITKYRISWS